MRRKGGAILYFSMLVVVFFILANMNRSGLYAQEQMEYIGRKGESFPYPFRHFTFIQPRFDRTNYAGSYLNTYVIRGVRTFDNYNHFRVEIPLANNSDVFGLSDIKMRLVHSSRLYHQFYLAYGAEMILPAATDESLGTGKWQARPEVGFIYFMGQPGHEYGTIVLGADYRFDYAGSENRSHISMLGIVPNIDYWAKRWYVGYYATWTYDFNRNIFDLPLDVECGYSITPKVTLSAEFIMPLLKDAGYVNELAAKLRYMF